jgi:flagellar motor switch protein FliM
MAANTPPNGGADSHDASAPRAYDFTRPGRLSPADGKRIGYLHGDLAKRLEMSLAGLVRDYVEVSAGDFSEIKWSGLVASLPSPCVVFMFEAPPLSGLGMLRLDPGLAFGLVDRLFGGTGEPADLGRELTPIEQRVVGRFADVVLAEIQSVWRSALDCRVAAAGFVSSSDLVETGGVDEPVLEVKFTLESGSLKGDIHIAYPHHMFEPAIRALAPKRKTETEGHVAGMSAEMVSALSLPITVRLAPTMVDMKHLVDLGIGDVLLLDNRVTEDVEVLVGAKAVMKGSPGSRDGRLAVRITRFSQEGGRRP